MKITTISLNRLRNNEYYRFIMEIVEIISDAIADLVTAAAAHDDLSDLISKINELLEKLDAAVVSLRKSEYTQPVAEADAARGRVYRGFVLHVKAFSHSPEPAVEESARRLQVLIDNYGDFRRRPMNEESAMMDNFLQDLSDLQMDNINAIGAGIWLTAMKNANDTLKDLMEKRHNERTTQIRENVGGLRLRIDALYRQTINLLEIGSTLEENAFSDLIKSVNERVSYYKTTLAIRKGRSDANDEDEENEDLW